MKQFLAIYLGTESAIAAWKSLEEQERKRRDKLGIDAWMKWANAHQAAIVVPGSPLGRTKRVSAQGLEDTRNELTGYVIMQAESHEAAARLFEGHPHFTVFPGDSVEVVECLSLPST